MKCLSCAANLSIEDEVCPHCGTPNPEAIRHRQDMRRFDREFHKTRSQVMDTASRSAQKSMRIVVICIMAVLLLLSLFFAASGWSIANFIQNRQAAANYETYSKILDTYEEEEDFLAFSAFYDEHYLYSVDAYDEYRYIEDMASGYSDIFYYIADLMGEESWEGSHARTLEYLCDSVTYYYERVKREPGDNNYYYYEELGAYDSRHVKAADAATAKMEGLLRLAFAMTEEEMKEFKTFSSAEKQVFLERRYGELE